MCVSYYNLDQWCDFTETDDTQKARQAAIVAGKIGREKSAVSLFSRRPSEIPLSHWPPK